MRKFVTLLLLITMLSPAFASPVDDVFSIGGAIVSGIIDFVIHPAQALSKVLQFLGLEPTVTDQVAQAKVVKIEDIPEEKQGTVEMMKQMAASYEFDVKAFVAGLGIDATETVHAAYQDGDQQYFSWTLDIKDGELVEYKEGRHGTPTMVVIFDSTAVEEIESDPSMENIKTLYLDNHIKIEPVSKVMQYAGQFLGM